MDEVCWGLIGCGDVAEYKGGPALYTVDHSRLVAVMSRNAPRAEDFARRHQVPRFYTKVDDLLADNEVDAVYIATPPHVHAELTIQAAQAGKHVLCEKPMAMTVAEGRHMIEVCRDHGVQLMIAYYRRFFPAIRKMKELVGAGDIGHLVRAHAAWADYYTPRADGQRAWLIEPEIAGGGFLTDVATHHLDLLTFFLGQIQEVSAFVDTQHFDFAVDDASVLTMRFENGTHATGAFNWNVGASIHAFEVCGTKGRLVARNLSANAGTLDVFIGDEHRPYELPAPAITHLGLVEHVVECLRTDRPNALSGEEGLQATRITEAAYQSARDGEVVRLG